MDEPLEELDEEEPESGSRSRFAGRGAGEILRELWTARAPGASKATAPGAPAVAAVNGLDPRERLMGIAAAVLAVAIAVTGYVADHRSKVPATAHQAGTLLAIGLGGAVLIALGVVLKRRALLGFASLLAGLALGLVGVVFIAFGGWLVFRAMRFSKERREAAGGGARGRGGSARTTGSRRGSGSGSTSPTPARPPASKRYTPPKRTTAASGKRR